MRYAPRMNRYERKAYHATKMEQATHGTGKFVYENNTDADLTLPKPTSHGIRVVGPRKRFEGDSYYLKLVGSPMNLLRLIEEIKTEEKTEKASEDSKMPDNKLILDQPDTITQQGTIEHVVNNQQPIKPLNDSTCNKNSDVLILENPLDGVAIIKG